MDGCSFNCIKENCGSENEERRRAPNTTEVCVPKICGNGVLDNGEACDDNNTQSEDECSLDCKIENCTN